MDFDTIKKNKPKLTDYKFLQKIIENKKQEIIIYEPTLIDKMCDKIKNSFYLFIENNIFILSIIMFIIILLIYRYFQYQNIKNKILIDQSQYDIDRNRLWSLQNPYNQGPFYNTLKLIVAGKDRETEWPSDIWENLSPFTKSEKTSGLNLSWLSVNYGPSYGYRAPEKRSPSGTLNFTIADKPTLYLNITDTLSSSLSGQKRTIIRAVTIGWGLYIVSEDRGSLRFAN